MDARNNTVSLDQQLAQLGKQSGVGAVIGVCGIALVLFGFFLGPFSVIAGILLALGGFIYSASRKGKMKKLAAAELIPQALSQVLENVSYDPDGRIGDHIVRRVPMGFPFDFDEVRGSDYICGTYKGLKMEMSDLELVDVRRVHTKNGTRTERITVFKGQWIVCRFKRELAADVLLSERSALGQMFKLGGIKTESEEFNKRFCIRSDSEHDVFYLLTPHRMERVLSMDAMAEGDSYLRFGRDGWVHIAVSTGRNLFEVGSDRDAESLRQKFSQEIRSVAALLDELCLDV